MWGSTQCIITCSVLVLRLFGDLMGGRGGRGTVRAICPSASGFSYRTSRCVGVGNRVGRLSINREEQYGREHSYARAI